jgi:hypothetical protein
MMHFDPRDPLGFDAVHMAWRRLRADDREQTLFLLYLAVVLIAALGIGLAPG